MKRIVLFTLLLLSVALYSEISIDHTQPYLGYKASNLTLDITVDGDWQEVLEVVINYRERGEVAFSALTVMVEAGNNGDFKAVVPISETSRGLEYYIEVTTKAGVILTHPENQPTMLPIMVQIIENKVNDQFVVLNDLKDIKEGSNFSLSVSLFNLKDELDYETIKFFKNGKDITKDVIITPTLLVYSIDKIRKSFEFNITAKTLTGDDLDSGKITVKVKQNVFDYELPFNLRGNVNYKGNTNNISYEDSANQNGERSTNTHSTIFNLSGHNEYLRVNSRLYLSSLENSDRQPVNRYSLDLRTRFLELYLGDKTPYLSEFTLNSTNIRGYGSKLDFKYFLLEGYWGSSNREISTKEISENNYLPGTFKRESGAIRLALGNKNSFQLGFNLAKNKDRIASLDYSDYYIPYIQPVKEDETDKQIINPVDNIVFSTDFKLSSPQKLYSIGAEIALSAYNSNIIDGAISQDELENDIGDSFPFDPESLDGFFVINKNTEPLSISTANLAYKIYNSIYIAGNLISVNYSQVGSAFNSLSAKNVNNDTKEFIVSDNINFHNTLFVDFSYNRVSDNLSENLATTNETSNYRVNSILRKEKLPVFRFNFNKGRTSISNNDELDIVADFDESQEFRTTAYGAGLGYSFDMVPFVPFSLDFDYQNSLDEDDMRDAYKYNNNSFYLRYRSKMTFIPLTTEISGNLINSDGHIYVLESVNTPDEEYKKQKEEWRRVSTRLRFEYEFVDLNMTPFFDFRVSNNENILDSDKDNSYSATSFGLSYYPFKLTSLTSSFTIKERSYENAGADYSAVNWYLNIVQKF